MGVEAALGVVGEDADGLERIERPISGPMGRHQADQRRVAGRTEDGPERLVDLAAGEGGEGTRHRLDAAFHVEQFLDLLLVQDEHGHQAKNDAISSRSPGDMSSSSAARAGWRCSGRRGPITTPLT